MRVALLAFLSHGSSDSVVTGDRHTSLLMAMDHSHNMCGTLYVWRLSLQSVSILHCTNCCTAANMIWWACKQISMMWSLVWLQISRSYICLHAVSEMVAFRKLKCCPPMLTSTAGAADMHIDLRRIGMSGVLLMVYTSMLKICCTVGASGMIHTTGEGSSLIATQLLGFVAAAVAGRNRPSVNKVNKAHCSSNTASKWDFSTKATHHWH